MFCQYLNFFFFESNEENIACLAMSTSQLATQHLNIDTTVDFTRVSTLKEIHWCPKADAMALEK